ncbi:hypothetical protein N9E25_05165 [Verrucomicrobiales bacterium]|nr:hypothetical protein [Verrucomicrobiales bacterium]
MKFLYAAITALFAFVPPNGNENQAPRPNIVFILADDIGYGDPHGKAGRATARHDRQTGNSRKNLVLFSSDNGTGKNRGGSTAPLRRWKLFMNLDGGKVDFYDLLSDPAEETNLAKKRPKAAAEMKRQLKEWFATTPSGTLGKNS